MTTEQILALLQHYITTRPEHTRGLCSWLSVQDDYNEWPYEMIGTFRNATEFSPSSYVSDDEGLTPERLLLAENLFDALKYGHLKQIDGSWDYTRPQV